MRRRGGSQVHGEGRGCAGERGRAERGSRARGGWLYKGGRPAVQPRAQGVPMRPFVRQPKEGRGAAGVGRVRLKRVVRGRSSEGVGSLRASEHATGGCAPSGRREALHGGWVGRGAAVVAPSAPSMGAAWAQRAQRALRGPFRWPCWWPRPPPRPRRLRQKWRSGGEGGRGEGRETLYLQQRRQAAAAVSSSSSSGARQRQQQQRRVST